MISTPAPDPRFWNRVATKYAAQPVANPEAFERKIAITRALMDPGAVVLDVGCGTGSLSLRLASAAVEVHGLDYSEAMIRIAREKASAAGAENVFFHCAPFDERFTALEPGSVDGVCAYSILHLVEDRAATLARIFRLLRPGGFFVSSTACLRESWVPYAAIVALMRAFGRAPSTVANLSKAALVEEIAAAGFEGIAQPDVGAEAVVGFVVARKPPAGG